MYTISNERVIIYIPFTTSILILKFEMVNSSKKGTVYQSFCSSFAATEFRLKSYICLHEAVLT